MRDRARALPGRDHGRQRAPARGAGDLTAEPDERRGVPARATPRLVAGLVFALGLLVRIAYLLEIRGTPVTHFLVLDAATYDRFARAILAGTFHGEQVYAMNALYPYVVAAVYKLAGVAPYAVLVAQAVVDAATCALTAWLGARLVSAGVGALAGIAVASYAPLVVYAGALLTPTWITFLCVAGTCALVRALAPPGLAVRWAAAAGLAFGLATIGRGNNVLFLPLAGAWLAIAPGAQRRVGAVVAFAACFLVPMAAIVARDHAASGHWVPVAANYAAFYVGHNPAANGLYVRPPWIQGAEFQDEVWGVRDAVAQQLGHPVTLAESARWLFAQGVTYARTHPAAEGRLLVQKFRCLCATIESPTNLNIEFARDWSPLLGWLRIGWGVLLPLAAMGAWALRREARRLAPLGLAILVPCATCLVVFVASEYRVPAVPGVAILAAAGVRALTWQRMRGAGAWAGALLLAVVLGVLAVTPPAALRIQAGKSGDDVNFGTLYARHDEWVAARVLYERGVSDDPGNGYAWRGLAVTLAHLGDSAGAARAEERARRLGALP